MNSRILSIAFLAIGVTSFIFFILSERSGIKDLFLFIAAGGALSAIVVESEKILRTK